MDKSVEKTMTLFRKSYAGRLTADERAEMACLLEDESMRRLYEEVGDDEYLIGEFRQYAGWEPVPSGLLGPVRIIPLKITKNEMQ